MKSHKDKIDKKIDLKRENTLWNHILTRLFHRGETIADKKKNSYIIWTSNLWTGGFYPIFKIKFNENKEIVKIETELSLYGKLCLTLLILIITIFTTFFLIIPAIEHYRKINFFFLIPVLLYSLLIFGFYIIILRIYYLEKRYLVEDLKIIVGVETKENIEKKEFNKKEGTFSKIIGRIFLYPFSVFIIIMSIIMIFKGGPNGHKGFIGALIAVGYLFADIKIILNKRKKTKANNV
ncbi:hypothetical protein SAMN05444411_1382 [Lutibacter oricola]|uniref:Uncharacterized protein n=1 Tax=Lutibacter oricola TaxID=762486 RepID=A0A1H3HG68_9FLAO|nr:hypothetical protein [Lutibacter oricola]SDY14452.1 hypothetical protein SAMN05444411_1382 [Lutibacter oricola]